MFIEEIAHRTLLFGVLLCSAAGSASVSFRPAITYQVGSKPAFVAAGDFNGDGKVDLAVMNAGIPMRMTREASAFWSVMETAPSKHP